MDVYGCHLAQLPMIVDRDVIASLTVKYRIFGIQRIARS